MNLGKICDIDTGKLDSNAKKLNGNYPFFTCSSTPSKIDEYAFDTEAILLAGNNANGIFHLNYYNGKFNAYQRTYVITVKTNNTADILFLYYELFRHLNLMKSSSLGSATRFLTKKMLFNLEVELPPLEIQKNISSILSSLDKKIQLNTQMNATLEAIGQALFKRWFVDFEFPDENGNPYRSSGGEMVDSELGPIPKGWEVVPLTKYIVFLNGLALQKYPPKDKDNFLPVIKIRDMKQGITTNTDKASTDIDEKYIINNGDILFSWSGSLDICIWSQDRGALNQHLFKVSSDKFSKWYVFYWIKHYLPYFRHIAEGKATTMGHIQRYNLDESLVLIPCNDIYEIMDACMNSIFNRIIYNKNENTILAKIRDTLLPKLMSGELRVPLEEGSG